jgi:hypothetical protein
MRLPKPHLSTSHLLIQRQDMTLAMDIGAGSELRQPLGSRSWVD